MGLKESLARRFLEKFEPEPMTGCWLWNGLCDKNGYGLICVHRFKNEGAHRVSWRLHRGNIPSDLFVLHRCNTPACVNPAHLYLGSPMDNMRDKMRAGRWKGGSSPRLGEKHHACKLTETQVIEILQQAYAGTPKLALARKYGISKSQIKTIASGKGWKHIDRSAILV